MIIQVIVWGQRCFDIHGILPVTAFITQVLKPFILSVFHFDCEYRQISAYVGILFELTLSTENVSLDALDHHNFMRCWPLFLRLPRKLTILSVPPKRELLKYFATSLASISEG